MNSGIFPPRGNGHPIPEVILRTRRSVMEAANEMHAARARRRRHAGIALFAIGALILLFTPALWSVANDLSTGEHFFDMPIMVLTLSLVLLSAMFAILLMTWKGGRASAEDE